MIKKIIALKNVGRFANCKAAGDVEFKELTLIYGGNGQGKTTLCAVFRSLAWNDGRYLSERKTRGQPESPKVEILTDDGVKRFDGISWDSSYSPIAIYDSEFIHENIYAGEMIDHDHKRKLYRVMVGEKGVELASRIDELDELGRVTAKELKAKKDAVEEMAPDGMTAKQFAKLKDDPNLEKSIRAKRGEVEALKRANEISAKSAFQPITIPTFPEGFATILSASLEDFASDVEKTIEIHLNNNTNGLTADWAAQGHECAKDEICPYCSQSTVGIEIVQAYSLIFGQRYQKFKDKARTLLRELEQLLGKSTILKMDRTKDNELLKQFWSQFADVEIANFSFQESVEARLVKVYEEAHGLIQKKIAAPLERIVDQNDHNRLSGEVEQVAQLIGEYNRQVEHANTVVAQRKETADAGNLAEEQLTLVRLEAARRRHSDEGKNLVGDFEDCQRRKKSIDDEKEEKRRELKEYSEVTFASYGRRINELLENFGADFRITNIVPQFVGGHPSSSYSILINDEEIGVGDAKTPRGKPAFRSTLSAGDKSSLALAFFIAQLEKQPNIGDLTVVLDDPFSSQDRSRRKYTQQLVCRKANDVEQVIVVSHDPDFLASLAEGITHSNIKVLQVARIGKTGGTIAECDIREETQIPYLRDISKLKDFTDVGTGDLLTVARTIRPVLETRLRLVLPHQFTENEWLGGMIEQIRNATPPSPLTEHQAGLAEIEDINDYSKVFHHDQNQTTSEVSPPDRAELETYVKRTLRFVGSA